MGWQKHEAKRDCPALIGGLNLTVVTLVLALRFTVVFALSDCDILRFPVLLQ